MDWCVKPPAEANHAPVAAINADRKIASKPGERVTLSAAGSSDPDGNKLSFRWFVYREAGTYGGDVRVEGAGQKDAALTVPADAAGKEFHVVLEVADDGAPPLTRYRRAVVSVK
jgi:hypothetical protein